MFTRVRNFIIQGGTFAQTSLTTAPPTSKGFKILHANIATGAFHDSGERFDAPKCHPNTRKAVLAETMQWIQYIEESEDILWLYGSAGAGKSAIVQTIAEMCAKLGLLVASFFFSRSSQSRNNEKHLIASIAYQLALSIPATRRYVETAVHKYHRTQSLTVGRIPSLQEYLLTAFIYHCSRASTDSSNLKNDLMARSLIFGHGVETAGVSFIMSSRLYLTGCTRSVMYGCSSLRNESMNVRLIRWLKNSRATSNCFWINILL
ncbi:hypothetical protein BYT27DRAFT_6516777 [Phlegmacium glaucopus]|nr:hypothetical protein BYT27DRAFT_6516777 [Phlegmacium glaucopus]